MGQVLSQTLRKMPGLSKNIQMFKTVFRTGFKHLKFFFQTALPARPLVEVNFNFSFTSPHLHNISSLSCRYFILHLQSKNYSENSQKLNAMKKLEL